MIEPRDSRRFQRAEERRYGNMMIHSEVIGRGNEIDSLDVPAKDQGLLEGRKQGIKSARENLQGRDAEVFHAAPISSSHEQSVESSSVEPSVVE